MATNNLGTLSIDVLANIANMVQDLGKAQEANASAAKQFQKDWEGGIGAVTDAFKTLAGVVGVGFSVGWVKEIVSGALEAAENVDHMSQALGLSTQTMQTVQFAAGLVGVGIDTATTAMARFTKSSEAAAAGSKQQLEAFNALGISSAQLAELLKNPDDLFITVAQHVSELGGDFAKAAIVQELFGRGSAQLIPLLNELGDNYAKLKQKAIDFGVVLDEQAQSTLIKTKEDINELGQAGTGLANQLAVALSPAIQAVAEELTSLATSEGTKNFFKNLGTDIAQGVIVIEDVAHAVNGWASSFDAAGASEKKAVGGMKSDLAGFVQDTLDEESKINYATDQLVIFIKQGFSSGWTAAENSARTATKDILEWIAQLDDKMVQFATSIGSIDMANHFAGAAASIRQVSAAIVPLVDDSSKYNDALTINSLILKTEIAEHAAYADSVRLTAQAQTIMTTGLSEFTASLVKGDIAGNAAKLAAAEKNVSDTAKELIDSGAKEATVNAAVASTFDLLTKAVMSADAAHANYDVNRAAGDAAMQKYLGDIAKLNDLMAQISSGLSGPYLQALDAYQKGEDLLNKTWADAVTAGKATHELALQLQAEEDLLENRLAATDDRIKEQHDQFQKLNDELTLQTTLLGTNITQQSAVAAGLAAYNTALKANVDLYGNAIAEGKDIHEVLNQQLPDWIALKERVDEVSNAVKNNNAVLKDWQQVVTGDITAVFATFNKDLIEGGNLMKDLDSLWKQVVESILANAEKLAFINPILNQVFGLNGTSGALPTQSIGSMWNNLSGAFGGGSGNASSIFGNIFGGGSAAGAGTFDATSGIGVVGSSDELGLVPDYLGTGAEGVYGGEVASGGGGFLDSIGGLSGVTAIVGGAMLGYQVGGIGGAAALAAAAYFIPVVGWIAGAVSIVNSLTGGGLLGTKWKPTGASETDITIGDDASVENSFQESKKKALFGGTKTKNVTQPGSADQLSGAEQESLSIKQAAEAFAEQFGQTVTSIIGGSYSIATDKAGKQTFSDTVLGQTYQGETQQQFAERLQSDNYLAVLDKMGLGASAFVAALQGDADKLAAAVQDFASTTQAANVNLGNGFKFMALSTDQTLIDVMKFVEGSQKAGESLQQTYARLAQAQQQYNQFAAQFAPATVYVDSYEQALSQLYAQEQNNIATANALAVAAGAEGASETDLANIRATAVQQMGALEQALEASAQSLAFSLGVTLIGTLDQVNGEIQAIVNAAKNGTGSIDDAATATNGAMIAVGNFGGAMTSVTKAATDAINLLLGNLSPLNDQAKLQVAMQGLAQGTVTKEQVLQIGQALYASSEAYVQLFAEVQQFPDKAAAASGGKRGGGGRSKGSSSGGAEPADFGGSASDWAATGLTPSQWAAMSKDDQSKLVSLLGEQKTLQAAQTGQQFQNLAVQIAEIATTKQVDFTQVIDKMGVSQADLEKGLGLKSDADLKAYIENIQNQQDSQHQDSMTIVQAINNVPQALALILQKSGEPAYRGSAPSTPQPAAGAGAPGDGSAPIAANRRAGASSGSGIPAGRVLSDGDANAIGTAVGRQIAPVLGQASRNGRDRSVLVY